MNRKERRQLNKQKKIQWPPEITVPDGLGINNGDFITVSGVSVDKKTGIWKSRDFGNETTLIAVVKKN